jgi:hypothetical protein
MSKPQRGKECKALPTDVRAGGAAAVWDHGRAVQVDPIKPALKAPGAKRLELIYDGPLSNFAFDFNLRRYTTCPPPPCRCPLTWRWHSHKAPFRARQEGY